MQALRFLGRCHLSARMAPTEAWSWPNILASDRNRGSSVSRASARALENSSDRYRAKTSLPMSCKRPAANRSPASSWETRKSSPSILAPVATDREWSQKPFMSRPAGFFLGKVPMAARPRATFLSVLSPRYTLAWLMEVTSLTRPKKAELTSLSILRVKTGSFLMTSTSSFCGQLMSEVNSRT